MPVRSGGHHHRSVIQSQQTTTSQEPDDFEDHNRRTTTARQMQNIGRLNAKCAGCAMGIFDPYIMMVLDHAWHAECLRCSECRCPLQEKCYCRGDQLFCRDDYFKIFGIKCNGCNKGICPNDLVRRTPRGDVYHVQCFICTTCRKQLSTGEEFHIIGDCEFNCKADYVSKHGKSSSTSLQQQTVKTEASSPKIGGSPCFTSRDPGCDSVKSDHQQHDRAPVFGGGNPSDVPGGPVLGGLGEVDGLDDLDDDEEMKHSESGSHTALGADCCDKDTKSVGGGDNSSIDESEPRNGNDENVSTKRRGPRTTIKAKQLELLKNAFAQTPKPTRHIRDQLSQETGLTMRVIQVWFQNRRSKERRMKQQNIMGAGRRCNMFRSRRTGGRSLREFDGDSGDIISGVPGPAGFTYFPDGPGNHSMDFFPGQVSPSVHPHPHGHPPPPGIFDFAHYRQPQNAAEVMAQFGEMPPNAHGMPGNVNHSLDAHFRQEMLSQSSTPEHSAFDSGMNGCESPVWQSLTMAQ